MWARLLFVYSKINPSQAGKGQTNKDADGKWTWKLPSQIKATRKQVWVGLIILTVTNTLYWVLNNHPGSQVNLVWDKCQGKGVPLLFAVK